MSQIEGFAVQHSEGIGTGRVVDMETLRRGRSEGEIHVLKEPRVCMFMLDNIKS